MNASLLATTAFAIGAAAGFVVHALLPGGKSGRLSEADPTPAITFAAAASSPLGAAAREYPAVRDPGAPEDWPGDFEALLDLGQRGAFLQELVSSSAERGEWRPVLDFLLSLPAGPHRSDALHALVAEVSRRHPEEALDKIVPQLQGIDHHNAVTEVAVNWAMADPLAAFDFAASEKGAPFRSAFAELAAYELAATDPAEAFRRIDGLRGALGPEDYEHARTGLLAGWAKQAPAAALDFALNHSDADPSLREVFVEAIVASHASINPSGTISLVESAFEDPETRAGATELVFEIWSHQDPSAAAEAAARLHPGESTDAIVVEIVREWRNYDESAANRWLASIDGISAEARANLELRTAEETDSVGNPMR